MDQINERLEVNSKILFGLSDNQEEKPHYQLPEVDEADIDIVQEPDSDLVKKVMADLEHFNEYTSLLEQRDQMYLQMSMERQADEDNENN